MIAQLVRAATIACTLLFVATEHVAVDAQTCLPTGRVPGFDATYYLQTYPDVAAAQYTVQTAWRHFALAGARQRRLGRRNGCPGGENPACRGVVQFDAAFYLRHHPDLNAVYGGDLNKAREHYKTWGKVEYRQPCHGCCGGAEWCHIGPFDSAFYLAAYPDVAKHYNAGNVKQHWTQFGSKEGRVPCMDCCPGGRAVNHKGFAPTCASLNAGGTTTTSPKVDGSDCTHSNGSEGICKQQTTCQQENGKVETKRCTQFSSRTILCCVPPAPPAPPSTDCEHTTGHAGKCIEESECLRQRGVLQHGRCPRHRASVKCCRTTGSVTPTTTNSFSCPAPATLKRNPATIICKGAQCLHNECCDAFTRPPGIYRCSQFACPRNYVKKLSLGATCNNSICQVWHCCDPWYNPNGGNSSGGVNPPAGSTCLSHRCNNGAPIKRNGHNALCGGGRPPCTDAFCCDIIVNGANGPIVVPWGTVTTGGTTSTCQEDFRYCADGSILRIDQRTCSFTRTCTGGVIPSQPQPTPTPQVACNSDSIQCPNGSVARRNQADFCRFPSPACPGMAGLTIDCLGNWVRDRPCDAPCGSGQTGTVVERYEYTIRAQNGGRACVTPEHSMNPVTCVAQACVNTDGVTPTTCAQKDAKRCPDGTYVSRDARYQCRHVCPVVNNPNDQLSGDPKSESSDRIMGMNKAVFWVLLVMFVLFIVVCVLVYAMKGGGSAHSQSLLGLHNREPSLFMNPYSM